MTIQRRIQDITHQRRFSTSADSSHYCKHSKRELHIYVLQIVLHCSIHPDEIIPGTSLALISLSATLKILESKGSFHFILIGIVAKDSLIDDFASVYTGFRTNINEQIGRTHYLFVMLNYYYSIADIPKTFEYAYQPFGIPRMKSDTRLIKNIKRAHKGTTQGSHKVDSLAFTT